MMFFMWQLFQGWQVRDGVSRGKEGQKVGRQKLRHLAKPETRNLTLGYRFPPRPLHPKPIKQESALEDAAIPGERVGDICMKKEGLGRS